MCTKKMITRDDALAYSDDPDKLLLAFRGISKSAGVQIPDDVSDKKRQEEKRRSRSSDLIG
ncbi:MAG: hypothetical protein Kow00107_09220 [Planctomycetota bacterium]